MIEEREGEDDPALAVDCHEAAVADTRHDALEPLLELLLAAAVTFGRRGRAREFVAMPFSKRSQSSVNG